MSSMEPKKIGGFDRWEVRDAMNTLKRADEIRLGDQKFLKVVLKEMDRESKKLENSADLLRKTKSRLNKVFKGK